MKKTSKKKIQARAKKALWTLERVLNILKNVVIALLFFVMLLAFIKKEYILIPPLMITLFFIIFLFIVYNKQDEK